MTAHSGAGYPHQLMTQTQRSADARMDAFLAEMERRALRMAELAVRDREEALDIVQDVMLAFVRRYARKPDAQWPPLFYRCLENRIRDWYRRQGTRNRWLVWLDEPGEAPAAQRFADPHLPGPAQRLGDSDFAQALEQALAALPHRQRQAFLYRTWEGLDVAETALAMGCGQGSVKTHLFRAMQTLREQLQEFQP